MKHLRYKASDVPCRLLIKTAASKHVLSFLKIFDLCKEPYINCWVEDFIDEDTGEVVSIDRKEPSLIKLEDFMIVDYVAKRNMPSWITFQGVQVDFIYNLV